MSARALSVLGKLPEESASIDRLAVMMQKGIGVRMKTESGQTVKCSLQLRVVVPFLLFPFERLILAFVQTNPCFPSVGSHGAIEAFHKPHNEGRVRHDEGLAVLSQFCHLFAHLNEYVSILCIYSYIYIYTYMIVA